MTDGLLFGWSSPFIVQIINDNVTYHISESEASYFAIIPTASMMVACLVFATLCDFIGRKSTLILFSIPSTIAWILKIFARDVNLFYLSRFFVGLGTGCYFTVVPMYVGEIADPKIRGILGSFITAFNFFGQFLITVLGNVFDVITTSYICLPLPILFFIFFFFAPESPYFYIMKGRFDEAKTSLWKLRRKENIDDDFIQLKTDVERQMSERGTWKDLIIIASNRKAVLVGAFLRVSQFTGGMNVFVSSAQFIFAKSAVNISAGVSAMLYSFITFASFLLAGSVIDKIGRRTAYTTALSLGSIMLLLESLYFFLTQNLNIDLPSLSWFPLGGMILYIILSAMGTGILPSIMTGEIFSTSIKTKANIIMVFLIALMSTITSTVFYQLFAVTGLSGPFLIFGLSTTISAVISYLYLPETRGKTLEEIQQMFKGKQ